MGIICQAKCYVFISHILHMMFRVRFMENQDRDIVFIKHRGKAEKGREKQSRGICYATAEHY